MANMKCSICGNKLKRKAKIYCSRECRGKAETKKFKRTCSYCGKAYMARGDRRGKKLGFCSPKCSNKYQVGPNSPHWKEGPKSDRDTPEYREWRLEVHKSCKFTCQKCRRKGVRLEAHHILAFGQFPEARFQVDNGASLCEDCHRDFHKAYGKLAFTDTQYWSWINE